MSETHDKLYYLIKNDDRYVFCHVIEETEQYTYILEHRSTLTSLTFDSTGANNLKEYLKHDKGEFVSLSEDEYKILFDMSFALTEHIHLLEQHIMRLSICNESSGEIGLCWCNTTIDIQYLLKKINGKWYEIGELNNNCNNIFLYDSPILFDREFWDYENPEFFYTQEESISMAGILYLEESIKRELTLFYRLAEYIFNVKELSKETFK